MKCHFLAQSSAILFAIMVMLSAANKLHSQNFLDDFPKNKKTGFTRIERQVRKLESTSPSSIQQIATSIETFTASELEKAYATYYWVCHAITYDMQSFLEGTSLPFAPKQILLTRTAVCSGYAHLFKAICDELHLKSEIIDGYTKGFGHESGQTFEMGNHSWNAVMINSRWFLVDCTWGSPNSNIAKYQGDAVSTRYFLTNPKEFAINHLPEDPSWQLLSPELPISIFEQDEQAIKNELRYGLIVNKKEMPHTSYLDIAHREVEIRSRILEFNPKNKSANYKLGVALLYQALDTLETIHHLTINNVLKELPKYQYRIYELLAQAAYHFEGSLTSNSEEIRKSAATFLDETIYQKGVFNYEAAQIIYDCTTSLSRDEVLPLQADLNQAINQYYDISTHYFSLIKADSWYYKNAQSYIQTTANTRNKLIVR